MTTAVRRLLLLAFIWGWSFLFIKVAVEGLTPSTVAWARTTLGATVLHLVLLRTGRRIPLDRTSCRRYAVAAVVSAVVPFTLLAWGEQHISSALTAVLNASTPLFTAALAAVRLRERLGPLQGAGLALGLVGVAVAAGLGASDLTSSSLGGALASVGAGLCYGMAFVYMRRHLVSYPPVAAAAGQLTAASILLLPFALATSVTEGVELTPTRVWSIALLGIVGTGMAYVLNYRLIADVGATRASLVTYAIPVVAVAVGVVALDEHFELRQLVGGLLIVGGIAAVNSGWRPGLRRPDAALLAGRGTLVLVLAVLLASSAAGCGDDGGSSAREVEGSCGTPRREQLDNRFVEHVLPGAEPGYLTDPPTSGPHQPAPAPRGSSDTPLSRPVQVGLLEQGRVLVQYRDRRDAEALGRLASPDVIVAPNPELPADVVATAWTFKLECDGVDIAALDTFVADHEGKGPDGH